MNLSNVKYLCFICEKETTLKCFCEVTLCTLHAKTHYHKETTTYCCCCNKKTNNTMLCTECKGWCTNCENCYTHCEHNNCFQATRLEDKHTSNSLEGF